MSVYYFDVEENGVIRIDPIGSELQDNLTAQVAALELLPDLGTTAMNENNAFDIGVRVRQADGKFIMTLKLSVSIQV